VYPPAVAVELVENREGRRAVVARGLGLGNPQRSHHVALPERPTGSRREDVILATGVPRPALVPGEHRRKLAWDRHRPRRAVGLGRLPIPLTIDLPADLDLGIVEVRDPHVSPGEAEQLRQARTCQGGDGEQGPVGLVGCTDRLLELPPLEHTPPLPLRRLRPLGGQHQ
jgi:hypothetical protein